MHISDGRRIRGEGEMDLAARSWKGTDIRDELSRSINFP